MNWEEELLDLYEKNSSKTGIIEYKEYRNKEKTEQIPYVLLPVFHTTAAAQIEIVIDEDGNFLDASKVSDEDKLTIIPVTEKSGSRTSGKEPHALCDNIQYLAGDYENYAGEKSDHASEYYELYIDALEKWHTSDYTHKKVDAIYHYLRKKELIKDLVKYHILVLENGVLDKKVKLQNVEQAKAFVRFIVRQKLSDELAEEKCWKDHSLQDCFIAYYRSLQQENELDYLTGRREASSYFHSKKIRNEGDGAKLISSNDKDNFTFRGRFLNKEQAFSIGNETSQKVHNALKWIIRKQGHNFDSLTMVAWESNMLEMPLWDADTEAIISTMDQTTEPGDFSEGETDVFCDDFQDDIEDEQEEQMISDGAPITARQFYQALNGYRKEVNHTSRMILMAFDAATTGRLALAEYKALETGRYLENIEKWHSQCSWIQTKFKNGKKKTYYGIPGIKDIAELLYGADSKGFMTISDKNGKRLYAEISKRLLSCIWDGRNIPYDLVLHAVNRASAPQIYEKRYNWERVLSLACSFVKKYRYDRYKEEWDVALDKKCKDRSYLYGRLLAAADRIEYRTFDLEKDSGRETNAKRYMSMFSQRPFETWKIIEENLQPYLGKLKAVERRYYENLLDSICELFDPEEFCRNTKLDGMYLLGFHCQSFDMKNYKPEEN